MRIWLREVGRRSLDHNYGGPFPATGFFGFRGRLIGRESARKWMEKRCSGVRGVGGGNSHDGRGAEGEGEGEGMDGEEEREEERGILYPPTKSYTPFISSRLTVTVHVI